MKIIVETEELKEEILKQSKYVHDFLINKNDVKGLGKDWLIGLDSDKAGILMHLYMAPQIIEVKQQKVMSKEKIILIHYINVGNIDGNNVSEMMEDVVNKFSLKEEDNIISYWIPVREGETRVECINPKLVSQEDFTEAKRVLDRNQEIVNNIINWKTKL